MEHSSRNGRSKSSLDGRFIKCYGCKVNLPREDVQRFGQCTLCKVEINCNSTSNDSEDSMKKFKETSFDSSRNVQRRWVEIKDTQGKTYYHNTENGEDQWEIPEDFEACRVDSPSFVPFMGDDIVKSALMMEQRKLEARQLGISIPEQQQQQQPSPHSTLEKTIESKYETSNESPPSAIQKKTSSCNLM